ncbi:MAG: hypothetical protein GF307_02705 [candidate division Zixibacteria bacterium]|nr:hypothetical protein [candidate division Zixibacteria bacterium]
MKTVGYLEGTNSEVLTQLFLGGHETIPLSNGWDGHGKNITHLSKADNIDVVIGYLHKFIPVTPAYSMTDMLTAVKVNKIPIIFIVPKDLQESAKKHVEETGVDYKFADPAELGDVIMKTLK